MKQEVYTMSREIFERELNTAKDMVLNEITRRHMIAPKDLKQLSKTIFISLRKPSWLSSFFKSKETMMVLSNLSDCSKDVIACNEMGIK